MSMRLQRADTTTTINRVCVCLFHRNANSHTHLTTCTNRASAAIELSERSVSSHR